jgi:hypothetical protein
MTIRVVSASVLTSLRASGWRLVASRGFRSRQSVLKRSIGLAARQSNRVIGGCILEIEPKVLGDGCRARSRFTIRCEVAQRQVGAALRFQFKIELAILPFIGASVPTRWRRGQA